MARTSFVVNILSVTLGLFFIFVGIIKLSPMINEDIYKEMRKQYIRMAKVFPLISLTGWKPNAHIYRKIVASAEVTCGAILVLIPGPLKMVANVLSIILNANDVLAHAQVKDGYQRMSLPLVFILLLVCRLMIVVQERRRERDAAEKQKTATEQSGANDESQENIAAENESKKTK